MKELSRRQFLGQGAGGLSAVALAGTMPGLLARAATAAEAAKQNDQVLLVVELAGGNDGLNTVVPFEDAHYYRQRPTLAIEKKKIVKLSDHVGFHPALEPLGKLFHDGQLAIVQGVGYPEPDRSHFRSMEIWHTASTNAQPPTAGWLGRFLDCAGKAASERPLAGLALTDSLPQALQAEEVVAPVVASFESFDVDGEGKTPDARMLRKLVTPATVASGPVTFLRGQVESTYRVAQQLKDAAGRYKSTVQYPESELGKQLRRAAQIISGDLGTRVLFASQGGYDTHASQSDSHSALLAELAAALAAFQQDLKGLRATDRVVTMVFSEFGRRVDENGSRGTDHGAASCMFLLGSKVKGGLAGKYPSLEKLGDGDLVFNTDFRSVYATVLDRWLGAPSQKLLQGKFDCLDVLPAVT
jgi:uncharacterized protein (DUF1501 family)